MKLIIVYSLCLKYQERIFSKHLNEIDDLLEFVSEISGTNFQQNLNEIDDLIILCLKYQEQISTDS